MLWNVYVVDQAGECVKYNSEPYDSEEVAIVLETLDDVVSIQLIPIDHFSMSNAKCESA